MNTAAPPLLFYAERYPGTDHFVPFLAPWWGEPKEDPASLNRGQYSAWIDSGAPCLAIADDPADADFLVLSIPWKVVFDDPRAAVFAQSQIDSAGRLGKRIVVFFDSDHDTLIDWPPQVVALRFSIYADTRRHNEFAIPPFGQDLLALHCEGQAQPRAYRVRPSISFCGYAPPLACRWSAGHLKTGLRYLLYRAGAFSRHRHLIAHSLRVRAILALNRKPDLDCHFLLRDQFAFNGYGVLQPGGDSDSAQRQRQEFVDNLLGADYALCVRGIANCSIRLYEAMSLGRIPVLIDSDCVLPYEEDCAWREFCLVIPERKVSQAARILREFHAGLSADRFLQMQQRARQAFVDWVSPEGYFRQIPRHWQATVHRSHTNTPTLSHV